MAEKLCGLKKKGGGGGKYTEQTFTTANDTSEHSISLGFQPKYVMMVQKTSSIGLATFECMEGYEGVFESWNAITLHRYRTGSAIVNVKLTLTSDGFTYQIMDKSVFGNKEAFCVAVE